jgi:hypothetical protein
MEEQPKATVAAIVEFLSEDAAHGLLCRRAQNTGA